MIPHSAKTAYYLALGFFIVTAPGCTTFKVPPDEVMSLQSVGVDYQILHHEGETAHCVTFDPAVTRLRPKKADQLEKPSSLAKNVPAAVNAGFFEADGSPAGAFKVAGVWLKKPKKNRGAVGWKLGDGGPKFYFDRIKPSNDRFESDVEGTFYENSWWDDVDHIVGGAPLLISDGEILDPEPEKTITPFLERKYARTAICLDEEERIKLVVVEGADSFLWKWGFRYGMSIAELSGFLLKIGCKQALNLDGGRSSAMIINGKMVNSQPIFYSERAVSDVLVIDSAGRKPSDKKLK